MKASQAGTSFASHGDIITGKGEDKKGSYYTMSGGNRRNPSGIGETFRSTRAYYNPETGQLSKNYYKGALKLNKELREDNLILKPRDSQYLNYTAYTALPNIAFYSGYNVYQILKYSNFNITIYSTTSVEAEFYGVKTLFFNIDNLSKTYFNIDKLYGALIDPLENISEHHLNTEERDSSSYFVSNYVNNVANCL
jgi:hypothetical protein